MCVCVCVKLTQELWHDFQKILPNQKQTQRFNFESAKTSKVMLTTFAPIYSNVCVYESAYVYVNMCV